MKGIILILVLVSNVAIGAPGRQQIDSLQQLLATAPDSAKGGLCYTLSRIYTDLNLDTAIAYGKQALKLVSDERQLVSVNQQMGSLYIEKGQMDKGLEYNYAAYKITKKLDDPALIARASVQLGISYQNLARVQKDTSKFPKAIEYITSALEHYKVQQDSMNIARSMTNLAIAYMEYGKKDRALEMYLGALSITDRMGIDKGSMIISNNIGNLYRTRGNYSEAIPYFHRSMQLARKLNSRHHIFSANYNLGLLYKEDGNCRKAIPMFEEGVKEALALHSYRDLAKNYHLLGECYAEMGQHVKAFEMQTLYMNYRDSMVNEESALEAERLEATYQNQIKQLEIDNLKKDQKVQQAELAKKDEEVRRQNLQKIAYASGLGLAAVLILVVFRSYRLKRRDNKVIAQQKEEVEYQKEVVEEKNREITDSITYAQRIQQTILPSREQLMEMLPDSFTLYMPKDIISGDFYWADKVGDKVLFAVCDCTGHGVPGALLSVVSHTVLNRCVPEFKLTQPAAILDKANELIEHRFLHEGIQIKDGMDVALCCYHASTNKLEYSGANNPLYHLRNGTLDQIKPDKMPIGSYNTRTPYTNHVVELNSDSIVYVFTDGYADQFGGPKGKKFKYKAFRELLLSIHEKPMPEQAQVLENRLIECRGEHEQSIGCDRVKMHVQVEGPAKFLDGGELGCYQIYYKSF